MSDAFTARRLLAAAMVATALWTPPALGQGVATQPPPVLAPAPGDADGLITLSFPENVPLQTLVAYVSSRLDLNIVYDESQVNLRVTLKTPSPVHESALLDLLQAVLQSRALILQETEVRGLMRIVPSQQLSEVAGMGAAADGGPAPTGAITQVFQLRHARAEQLTAALMPFLTKPGGVVSVLPEQRVLIVTDYAANMERIARLVETVDRPGGEATLRSVPIEHGDAQQVLKVVQPLLQAMTQAGDGMPQRPVMAAADPRTNQLILVGAADRVEEVAGLIASLDAPAELERRVYRPRVVAPDRLDTLLKKVLSPEPSNATYRSASDPRGGTLVITAAPAVHEQIARLMTELDVPPSAEAAPVRFYKLTNTLARDVAETIDALQGGDGRRRGARDRDRGRRNIGGVRFDDARGGRRDRDRSRGYGSDNDDRRDSEFFYQPYDREEFYPLQGQDPPGQIPLEPPAPGNLFGTTGDGVAPADVEEIDGTFGRGWGGLAGGSGGEPDRRRPSPIAVDESTNSIIVVAPPAEQRVYEQIIRQLDQRRPQVLIEVTVVTLDTSDGFTFGVDIGLSEDEDVFFSAFGLSTPDPDTGGLDLGDVGAGGTLAILSPDVADVVIRALSTSSRSRLVSMPRILVNDNEEGYLDSVDQVPFLVTVSSGDNLAFQSTDFAEAGTTISVTPHISDGDYLQLEYDLTLSSFSARPLRNLPPPEQQNNVASVVTIPDSHTIIVGGLNQQNETETINKFPFLGDIPIIKHAFRSRDTSNNNTTLFVFIRPTILRDARFRDLRHLSGIGREEAGVADEFPESETMMLAPEPDAGGEDGGLLLPANDAPADEDAPGPLQ